MQEFRRSGGQEFKIIEPFNETNSPRFPAANAMSQPCSPSGETLLRLQGANPARFSETLLRLQGANPARRQAKPRCECNEQTLLAKGQTLLRLQGANPAGRRPNPAN